MYFPVHVQRWNGAYGPSLGFVGSVPCWGSSLAASMATYSSSGIQLMAPGLGCRADSGDQPGDQPGNAVGGAARLAFAPAAMGTAGTGIAWASFMRSAVQKAWI